MHKSCSSACCYYWHNPQRLYNNCYNTPSLPRNCASCILTNSRKDDEWKWYSRSLTGLYGKNVKRQFDTPLWRRAQRGSKEVATSMIDLSARQSEASYTKFSTKKSRRKIARPAEIIIDRQAEGTCGGPLGSIASRPTCLSHRMAQLLLQEKLCDKCKCNPYDSVPDVPLTFYPKWRTYDNYGIASDDEYAQMLINLICTKSGRCLRVGQMLNKTFLKSLNELYANVGGGGDGRASDSVPQNRYSDMEQEFIGFFGETNTSKKENSYVRTSSSIAVGSNETLQNRRSTFKRKSEDLYEEIHHDDKYNNRKFFQYPTKTPNYKRGFMSLDAQSVKKYLTMQPKSKHSFQRSSKQLRE